MSPGLPQLREDQKVSSALIQMHSTTENTMDCYTVCLDQGTKQFTASKNMMIQGIVIMIIPWKKWRVVSIPK